MRRFLRAGFFHQERLIGGAAVLAITQFLASAVGLLRDRLLTQTFPGLDVVDVYIAAFRPSDLLFQVAIMAGLSTVFVPLLARYRSTGNRAEMSRLLTSVMFIGTIAFGILALGLAALLPIIAPKIVGFEGESLELYVTFARLALLTNALFVLGNALGQYLITVQRYVLYGLTPVLYTLGTIVGTVWLTPVYGALGPMLGTLIGAIIYVVIRFVAVLGQGYRPVLNVWHPDLVRMGLLMVPRMIALGALQLELLVFDSFASFLEGGAVTINAYARNFESVVIGVVGIALAQSAFSPLSQAAARGEMARFRTYLRKGVTTVVIAGVACAVLLVALAPVEAWLVHLTKVLPVFTWCLALYAVAVPFECLNHLLLRSYYALHATAIPAALSVLSGVTGMAVSWALLPSAGIYAIAAGFTAGQVVLTIGLGTLLPWRMRWRR